MQIHEVLVSLDCLGCGSQNLKGSAEFQSYRTRDVSHCYYYDLTI